nr:hypothetical protein [Morganella morganii]
MCVNVLTHEHQALACDFAGLTAPSMDAFLRGGHWQSGALGPPCLHGSLARRDGVVAPHR